MLHGDTAESPMGIGTFGSRSIAVDGAATYEATKMVKEKAAKIAAHLLEASDEDIVFADGGAHVAGSRTSRVDWADDRQGRLPGAHAAPEASMAGLEAHASLQPRQRHLAVRDAPRRGRGRPGDRQRRAPQSTIGVDDCGNVINPMIVDGQIHGGIAQGIGQALFEEAIYDEEGNC